jgi:hypothetical protein
MQIQDIRDRIQTGHKKTFEYLAKNPPKYCTLGKSSQSGQGGKRQCQSLNSHGFDPSILRHS